MLSSQAGFWWVCPSVSYTCSHFASSFSASQSCCIPLCSALGRVQVEALLYSNLIIHTRFTPSAFPGISPSGIFPRHRFCSVAPAVVLTQCYQLQPGSCNGPDINHFPLLEEPGCKPEPSTHYHNAGVLASPSKH